MTRLLQVTGPHFCAAVEVGVRAAPILRYMTHWTEQQIRDYCARKGWKVESVMTARKRWQQIEEVMHQRFTSKNDVPVERASIRKDEWDSVLSYIEALESEIDEIKESL